MMNAPSNLFTRTLLILTTCVLASCGGGGGNNGASSSSAAPDTTPNAIAFTASTNAEPNAAVTSPAVTISGIDAEANISISGGEYSINGAAFTSAAGKISNGQSLVVRVTASDKTNTAKSATVTVGGVSATFSVTTLLDVTPASFTLAPVTNAALGATVTSAAVTLSGFDIAVPVSITGGEYSINGGEFTSAAGTVSAAQTVAVKLVASANHSTTTTAQLTVGGVNAGFSVTTLPDSTPDTFSFTAKTGAAINTAYTSDAVTVKGIDTTVPVSITGGEYSINGGAFTSAAGTVVVNDTVSVKATAANGTELTHNAVLTIGSVTGTYAITTVLDTTAPVAEFKFPTPYTMSEANSVKVRGTATDEHSITAVKLVVGATEIDATPKSDVNGVKDFSSWTATIPLTANTDNEIKVIATDDRNNITLTANANKVTVRQADAKSAFPSEVNQFDEATYTTLDNANNHNRLLVADRGKIWAVDFATGERTLFVDHHTLCSSVLYGLLIDDQSDKLYGMCDNTLYEFDLSDGSLIDTYIESQLTSNLIFGLALDRNNGRNRLVMVEDAYEHNAPGGIVLGFSLDTKQFSLISNANNVPLIKGARNILVVGDKYLVTTGGQHADGNTHRVISVDASTGERSLVSDNSIGNGELFSGELPDGNWPAIRGIVLDNKNLFISESLSNRLISLNLDTGERSLFKNLSYYNENSVGLFIDDLDLDSTRKFLIATDSIRDAVIIIDLESREKLILSKSKNDF